MKPVSKTALLVAERRPSGAEAHIFGGVGGTAKAVPYPKPSCEISSAKAFRIVRVRLGASLGASGQSWMVLIFDRLGGKVS